MHINTESSPLSPKMWPFSLELLPVTAYMVGGAVRDALLGRRREYLDLDFVLPAEAVKTARKIADHYKAGFVLLDPERQIARVVFGQATADFAQQEGASLETDLHRRDFTINAIAYNPHTGELIDPLEGYADLQQGIIRMVSPANLEDDPLRLLRAYRQASQLNFVLESQTLTTLRQLGHLLSQVAAERVRVELSYLLATPQGTPWLISAWKDGLLQVWFPSTTAENLHQLTTLDHSAECLAQTWPELGQQLSSWVGETLKISWLGIAKLALLLSPMLETAEAELLNLKYSRTEIRGVITALRFLPQLKAAQMSLREQYFFFQGVGSALPVVVVLAVNDGVPIEGVAPLINRYLNLEDQVAHPTPLVSGNELMKALNLSAGPQLGKLLSALGVARAEGKIATPAEALEFAAQLVDRT